MLGAYAASPFAPRLEGLEAIAEFWEGERESANETFELAWEPVAVEGDIGVARVDVRYGGPTEAVFRDLWIVTLDSDGRCTAFEEWWFPEYPRTAWEPPK